jgi:hypothetical protein
MALSRLVVSSEQGEHPAGITWLDHIVDQTLLGIRRHERRS